MHENAAVLGIFTKQPRPGYVKTRLAAQTSPEWAARLAEALLLDSLARWQRIHARRIIVFTPSQARGYFTSMGSNRFELESQCDGDLGQRLEHFFVNHLRSGATRMIAVGSDSPTLPASFIEHAIRELNSSDVVLGPATDGGYYLLGCRRLPPIFAGVAWGSHHVLHDSITRLRDGSWKVSILPPWYDIDSLDDLWMLRGHLLAMRLAGDDPGLPNTEPLLDEIGT
jgi:rSAM/selenodomain-associated transferase 1